MLKYQISSGNIASATTRVKLAAGLTLLLCSAACADPEVGTLVRFQGGKPNTSWKLQAATDAAADSGGETEPDPDIDANTDAGANADVDASAADASSTDEDAGADSSDAAAGTTACTIRLTTRAQGGRYAPKNIGAIWIERDDGTWVKTLKVWAGVRLRHLTTYLEANTKRDTTDATTSATLRQHASHEAKWNLSDAEGKVAPDGNYCVRVEVTDRSGEGQLLSVPFSKSGEAMTVSPGDSEFFVDVELSCS